MSFLLSQRHQMLHLLMYLASSTGQELDMFDFFLKQLKAFLRLEEAWLKIFLEVVKRIIGSLPPSLC